MCRLNMFHLFGEKCSDWTEFSQLNQNRVGAPWVLGGGAAFFLMQMKPFLQIFRLVSLFRHETSSFAYSSASLDMCKRTQVEHQILCL